MREVESLNSTHSPDSTSWPRPERSVTAAWYTVTFSI
jgi:hypothetical protein